MSKAQGNLRKWSSMNEEIKKILMGLWKIVLLMEYKWTNIIIKVEFVWKFE